MATVSPLSPVFSHPSTSWEEQYRAAMNAVALIDRSHLARVHVSGADRQTFLQNMLTCDVGALGDGQGAPGSFLTNKGKMVAAFSVFREAERFVLEMEETSTAAFVPALSRYIISEDASVERVESETSFSVEGPDARALVESLSESPDSSLSTLPHLGFVDVRVCDLPVRIVRHLTEPSPRFDLIGSPDDALVILDVARREGAVPLTERVAETRRIEAGRARFGLDVDDTYMPLEAGFDAAISFDKGCYIGQEYVVRVAHRGHVNRKLVGLVLDGEHVPNLGTPVSGDSKPIGETKSAARSLALDKTIALAVLRREFIEPGTAVTVAENGTATVAKLPFGVNAQPPSGAPST